MYLKISLFGTIEKFGPMSYRCKFAMSNILRSEWSMVIFVHLNYTIYVDVRKQYTNHTHTLTVCMAMSSYV